MINWKLLHKKPHPHLRDISLTKIKDLERIDAKLIYNSLVDGLLNKDFRYKYCTKDFSLYSYNWQHKIMECVYNPFMQVFLPYEIKFGVCPEHREK